MTGQDGALHPSVRLEQIGAQFVNPPKDFSPVPIWWWSADRLDPERLRWQLERFAEGGVFNLIVLNLAPTGPLYGSDADDPFFLTEDWWRIFEGVCEDAEELGVRLWFYDQLGFSGANLQGVVVHDDPNAAGQWLESLEVEGEGMLELTCPAEGIPLAAATTPIAADGRSLGAAGVVTIQGNRAVAADGGRKRLRLVYAITRGFDYFSADACRRLLDTVHGAMERRVSRFFGKVIVGSFQDELPSLPMWGRTFAAEFQARKGYDIVPHLPALWDSVGPEADRMRVDYHEVRAALAEEAFFRPLFDWHERHDLLCGFDQQGPARAGEPRAAVQFYADYLQTHRWYTVPGSDHHGEAKIHSSLAHLYGRPRVWIESFHSSGWGGTLEETFDWLLPWLRAGANLYNPHAVYYSTRGGWWEWAPPSTCWRQPYWRHYSLFARAVSRLCYLLSQGDHVCDIGVVYPTTTVQAGMAGSVLPGAQAAHDTYLALVGSMFWNAMRPGVLDRDRRDYDILDEDSIQRAMVAQGSLQIGAERYRAIVLPAITVLEAATAETFCRFVEDGGSLIAIGSLPSLTVGGGAGALSDLLRLFENGRAQQIAQADDLPQALTGLPRQVDAPVPTLLRRIGDIQVLFVPAAAPMATVQDESGSWLQVNYSFDTARYQRPMRVFLRGVQSAPELWDPLNGERRSSVADVTAEGVSVEIPFDNGPAALLIWSAAQGTAPAAAGAEAVAPGSEQALAVRFQPWRSEIAPTMDNRFGDFTKPNFAGSPPVQTWTFEHHAEQPGEDGLLGRWFANTTAGTAADAWQPVKATYAVRAWQQGARPLSELPAPLASLMGGADPLDVDGWQPVVYSPARGIDHDSMHHHSLGPKGHVPEEFMDFGLVQVGQGVQLRTTVWAETERSAYLAVGAPTAKSVWLNGEAVGGDRPGYLWLEPVTLRAGTNLLEIRFTVDEETVVRAYWALLEDAERFIRPEWMISADAPHKDSLLRFTRRFPLSFSPAQAVLQVGADTPCRILVNGAEIGRQGGFDPYHTSTRIHPHTVNNLRQGDNQVTIEVQDMGATTALLVDGKIVAEDGRAALWISDGEWQVQRDDGPVTPVQLRRKQRPSKGWSAVGDPAFAHLWRRAHPLPAAGWLEDAPQEDVVIPVTPDPFAGQAPVAWLRWTLPPGATEMRVPVNGRARLWVDGQEMSFDGERVPLVASEQTRRRAVMRVEAGRGAAGGGLLDGPVTYTLGSGVIELGEWADQGLASYSGGVRYRSSFALDEKPAGALVLDLGQVRGVAEVWVNGTSVGARIWSPYRFDISGAAQTGDNEVEVLILNTLAPYLAAHSPTHYTFPIQMKSGLMGPVQVVAKT